MLGLALPAVFILYRSRTRWVARELAPVPSGLAWGAVLWVWSEATIPLVLALIHAALGRGRQAALGRMYRSPLTREDRVETACWTALGLAALVAVTWGVHAAAEPLGLGPIWSQNLIESLLLGTDWEATGTAVTLLVAAPFLLL